MGSQAYEVKIVVTDHASGRSSKAVFARKRLEPPRQRIPIQVKTALPFAPLEQQVQPLNRQNQFERLHPLDFNLQRIFLLQVRQL